MTVLRPGQCADPQAYRKSAPVTSALAVGAPPKIPLGKHGVVGGGVTARRSASPPQATQGATPGRSLSPWRGPPRSWMRQQSCSSLASCARLAGQGQEQAASPAPRRRVPVTVQPIVKVPVPVEVLVHEKVPVKVEHLVSENEALTPPSGWALGRPSPRRRMESSAQLELRDRALQALRPVHSELVTPNTERAASELPMGLGCEGLDASQGGRLSPPTRRQVIEFGVSLAPPSWDTPGSAALVATPVGACSAASMPYASCSSVAPEASAPEGATCRLPTDEDMFSQDVPTLLSARLRSWGPEDEPNLCCSARTLTPRSSRPPSTATANGYAPPAMKGAYELALPGTILNGIRSGSDSDSLPVSQAVRLAYVSMAEGSEAVLLPLPLSEPEAMPSGSEAYASRGALIDESSEAAQLAYFAMGEGLEAMLLPLPAPMEPSEKSEDCPSRSALVHEPSAPLTDAVKVFSGDSDPYALEAAEGGPGASGAGWYLGGYCRRLQAVADSWEQALARAGKSPAARAASPPSGSIRGSRPVLLGAEHHWRGGKEVKPRPGPISLATERLKALNQQLESVLRTMLPEACDVLEVLARDPCTARFSDRADYSAESPEAEESLTFSRASDISSGTLRRVASGGHVGGA